MTTSNKLSSSQIRSDFLEFFRGKGHAIVPSAPVGHDGTEAWLQAIGNATNVPQALIDAAKNQWLPAIKGALEELASRAAYLKILGSYPVAVY